MVSNDIQVQVNTVQLLSVCLNNALQSGLGDAWLNYTGSFEGAMSQKMFLWGSQESLRKECMNWWSVQDHKDSIDVAAVSDGGHALK